MKNSPFPSNNSVISENALNIMNEYNYIIFLKIMQRKKSENIFAGPISNFWLQRKMKRNNEEDFNFSKKPKLTIQTDNNVIFEKILII